MSKVEELRQAIIRAEATGEPQPIRQGRCERIVGGGTGVYGTGHPCNGPGRWLVRYEIRCEAHIYGVDKVT